MPNWCDCTYEYVGDLKDVRLLYKTLKYINERKTSIVKNGFDKWWLENLVVKLGGNWEKYRCRGGITYYKLSGNIFIICRNTVWREQEGVRKIVEEKFPSIKVYYRGERSECGVYYTNDANGECLPEGYYLDFCVGDSEYFTTIEKTADHVSGTIGGRVEPDKNAIEETLDEYTEELDDEDARHSFHEFTVADG